MNSLYIPLGGEDFQSINEVTLPFPEGETRLEYNISIIPDLLVENDEELKILLLLASGTAEIDPNANQSLAIITNDDSKFNDGALSFVCIKITLLYLFTINQ